MNMACSLLRQITLMLGPILGTFLFPAEKARPLCESHGPSPEPAITSCATLT